jgi:uncharacterized protein YjbI with pentapeptide repeats
VKPDVPMQWGDPWYRDPDPLVISLFASAPNGRERSLFLRTLATRWRATLVRGRRWIKPFTKFLWLLPVSAALSWALWRLPQWQVNSYRAKFDTKTLDSKDRLKLEEDLIAAENNARATLAQIIAGTVLLSGLYFTWRNIRIGQDNLRITEEGKLTDRFSKAVELLGSKKLDIRLGGIYALERIAMDSRRDHWTVMEVLAAFIREHSPHIPKPQSEVKKTHQLQNSEHRPIAGDPPQLPTDIQTALTVIGRRKGEHDAAMVKDGRPELRERLNLGATSLQNATLSFANLSSANFADANLTSASLRATTFAAALMCCTRLAGADLSVADLSSANLTGADLTGADLTSADLTGADLTGASLSSANLTFANLSGANLSGADLTNTNLAGADLTNTNLAGANLLIADLTDTQFFGADLIGADLRYAKHLAWEQVLQMRIGDTNLLPPQLEERWKKERPAKTSHPTQQ